MVLLRTKLTIFIVKMGLINLCLQKKASKQTSIKSLMPSENKIRSDRNRNIIKVTLHVA